MNVAPDEIRRAKETDLAALVSRHVKLTRRGTKFIGLCPFHAERTPSFKVEDGRYFCFGCGANGDAIEWLRATAGLPFRDAVAALTGEPRVVVQKPAIGRRDVDAKVREARAIWASGQPITGTRGADYLRARGIENPDNPSLRFIAAFIYQRTSPLPAMVAAIVSGRRELIGVQVTVLDPAKPCKASVATPRKTYGRLGDGAVRLAAAGNVLGLAEGVETGLSAMQLSGVPVWCCLGAARMDQVKIPETVRELHIFGDDDDAGRTAMERTAAKNRYRRVVLRLPPEGFNDWNDFLRSGAP